ncbi:hypothetical protein BDW59DRAFT_152266 [Aspergillus cavernicola]|uniref:Uncharacterized protein n=1 Tax=Aspergillus cavernicola TaxID=176166 RepID=A0ABR4HRV8_9EURO
MNSPSMILCYLIMMIMMMACPISTSIRASDQTSQVTRLSYGLLLLSSIHLLSV